MRQFGLVDVVTFLCALGSGLIAGLFFVFSNTMMRSLASVPPAHGIAVMQAINVIILNPLFLTIFMGTAVAGVFLTISAFMNWQAPGQGWLVAGSVLYVVGSFLVTMVFNVPRNNALAAIAPDSAEGATLWASYLQTWTAWNHVRAIASLAAMASFVMALRLRA